MIPDGPGILRAALTINPPYINKCMLKYANESLSSVDTKKCNPGVAVEIMREIQYHLSQQIYLQYVPGEDSWEDILRSFQVGRTIFFIPSYSRYHALNFARSMNPNITESLKVLLD